MLLRLQAAAAVALLCTGAAYARDYKTGPLTVSDPWTRATPGGAQVAVGYLRIRNDGQVADRLTGGTSSAADVVDVHEMSTAHGMADMRPLAHGLAIAPGATVDLKPGSYHLMLQHLKEPLKEGETINVTLDFQKAGSVPVAFSVESMGAKGFKQTQ